MIKTLGGAKYLIELEEGGECWTDAFIKRFGERVCVGLGKYPTIIKDGVEFEPTEQEQIDLSNDILIQEWGTTDTKEILRMEGF